MNVNFYNINPLQIIQYFRNGNKIHIKKENRGKFTEYCGGKVTDECIQRGKSSSDPKIRKRATFADNARKWTHKNGGKSTYEMPQRKLNPHSTKIQSSATEDSNTWMAEYKLKRKHG